ncbi:Meiosis regulator and mRNA stability factor 1-like protein [Drosera capensis]
MAGDASSSTAAEEQYVEAKTSVWWDIENCQVPRGCDPDAIAQNISSALKKINYRGPVSVSAYGDTSRIPWSVQQALSSTGISLNHVPAGVKDASDKKILVDMLFWAVDNPAPANYLLISGDRDFSNALHQLRMRRYNILLAQPLKASTPLVHAAKTVWMWSTLVIGGSPLAKNESNQFINADNQNAKEPSHTHLSENTHMVDEPQIPVTSSEKLSSAAYEPKYVPKRSFQRSIKKALSMPHDIYGATDHIAGSDQSNSNCQTSLGNSVSQSPSTSMAGSLPMSNFSVPTNQFPSSGNGHAFRPMPLRPSSPSISSVPLSTAPDTSKLSSSAAFGNPSIQYPYTSLPSSFPMPQYPVQGNPFPLSSDDLAFHARPPRPDFSTFPSVPYGTASNMGKNFPVGNSSYFRPVRAEIGQSRPNGLYPVNGSSMPNGQRVLMNQPYNANTTWNGCSPAVSSFEASNMTSMNSIRGTGGFIPRPPAPLSEYEQGLIGVILLALEKLKNEKIKPTEAHITDCIRCGDPKHRDMDVKKALNSAVQQQIVVKHTIGNLIFYVNKNQKLWNCVNEIGGNPNQYQKALWDGIQQFLSSSSGQSTFMASKCRYEAALILKNSCLQDHALGEVLQILNMLMTSKKWVKQNPSGWQITLPESETHP